MWKSNDNTLPTTAEFYQQMLWSDAKIPQEYSPYVGKSDWREMYSNPYEKDDDWDDTHFIPAF